MSKVTEIIQKWDTDRTECGIIYHYTTPLLPEDAPAHTEEIHENELIEFIMDFHLCDHQDLAAQFLTEAFEDVKDRYWDDVLHPKLVMAYKEATTYLSAYFAQCSSVLNVKQINALMVHIYNTLGIWVAQEEVVTAMSVNKVRRAA